MTDKKGAFSVIVPSGFYDLFVSKPAFTPVAAKVHVQPGKQSPFDAKLVADPLISKELGD
jgi:hypothetical protein